jgi:hypothetical protein
VVVVGKRPAAQKILVGPVRAKISRPITARRDRGFRIRGLPHFLSEAATSVTIPQFQVRRILIIPGSTSRIKYPKAIGKREDVGLGLGSGHRRNRLLRTYLHTSSNLTYCVLTCTLRVAQHLSHSDAPEAVPVLSDAVSTKAASSPK